MKTSRAFALASVALVVGFVAAHWCFAQPSGQAPPKGPARNGFGSMEQLESFISYLQDTKQTNTLHRFHDFITASDATLHLEELGQTLAVLQRLRDGRTNQAYELLEGRLSTYIIFFVRDYRELPASAHDQAALNVLAQARDYRARFPFKHQYSNVDEGVADAFKILDEQK